MMKKNAKKAVKKNVTVNYTLKHFNINEFDDPTFENSGVNMDPVFLQQLDKAREIARIPFRITSGYRTVETNNAIYKKLGKEPIKSSHLVGKAADIAVDNSQARWIIIDALKKAKFNRIGIGDNFIHVDNDQTKVENVIWTY